MPCAEKRSFTDAEVVELSKQFVRVEVDISEERNLRPGRQYRIDSIPRTIIFTPDGKVIERSIGYIPADEYAAWLKGVGNSVTATVETRPRRSPQPPSDFLRQGRLIIWFVDADREPQTLERPRLDRPLPSRRLLAAAGLRPRIEHISRDEFADRWDRGKASGSVPDLITADKLAGLVRELERKGN